MKNKTVIITGGSSGIGRALAGKFLREKANVVITGRNSDKLKKALSELKNISESVLAIQADSSVFTDCENVIKQTLQTFGSIDVLINNAGMSMRGLFENTDLKVIKKLMDINFWGTVYMTKLALPHLLKSKGSVVGISSIAGKKGLPGRTGYSSSKFAMEGFLETLRTENLKKDLHVLVACPGFTSSDIRNASLGPDGNPQKESPLDESKLMSADKVADKIFKAIRNRKRDLILTSDGKLTVLLNKFFPGILDNIVYSHMAKEHDSPFK